MAIKTGAVEWQTRLRCIDRPFMLFICQLAYGYVRPEEAIVFSQALPRDWGYFEK
jgi:hypothetical protein